jgi:hypothetical protein
MLCAIGDSECKVNAFFYIIAIFGELFLNCDTALSFKIAHMFPKISLFYRRHTANIPAKNSTTDSMSLLVLNI